LYPIFQFGYLTLICFHKIQILPIWSLNLFQNLLLALFRKEGATAVAGVFVSPYPTSNSENTRHAD